MATIHGTLTVLFYNVHLQQLSRSSSSLQTAVFLILAKICTYKYNSLTKQFHYEQDALTESRTLNGMLPDT